MITAKNYAAQAIEGCKNLSEILNRNGWTEDSMSCQIMGRKIAAATHFAVPDGGEIFDDGLKGIAGFEIRLPYPQITIEYFVNMQGEGSKYLSSAAHKRLVYAEETSAGILVWAMWVESGCWVGSVGTCFIPNQWDNKESAIQSSLDEVAGMSLSKQEITMTQPIIIFPKLHAMLCQQHGKKIALKMCAADLSTECVTVLSLCEALSCKNVSMVNLQDSSFANTKRIKAGKLPFYETKMLVINTHAAAGGKSGCSGSSHASPRQHLRRGHIRRLESGNIWVNSCIVGDPSKGIIKKQYSVV